jgi:ferredoxin-NADP reductase
MSTATKAFAQLRRDLRALADSVSGRHAPPFRPRTARVQPTGAHRVPLSTRRLAVVALHKETRDATTIVLADPSGAAIDYLPGQFFTLVLELDGKTVRRAYSACRPAGDGGQQNAVAVTSKRIAGGLVSTYLNERLRVGDQIDVLGPSGSFTVTPDAKAARELVLLGGGSGITPLMAIARTVLAVEPKSRVTLIYGNRGEDDIIFHAALAELAVTHRDRFRLRHVLSDPPAGFGGGRGVLDQDTCARELDAVSPTPVAQFYVCGPAPMMAAARAALEARGIGGDRIHEERFASPASPRQSATATAQAVVARISGRDYPYYTSPGQTLLEAGLAAGVPMPYSCTLGGCGACKVKINEGGALADEPGCLTPAEQAQGYVLACISRPTSPCKIEVHK